MADTSAVLQFEEIVEPKGDERLASFSTGSADPWDLTVNSLVAKLYADGKVNGRGHPIPQLFVLGMFEEDELLGICAWIPKDLVASEDDEPYQEIEDGPPPYIHLLGVDERHRGEELGDNLLVATLEVISQQWTGPSMPEVWGLVHRKNYDCQDLVARHGFRRIGNEPAHDDFWVRPAGLELF
jgi:ribosomal protein S18 acetylase RimI-like enzyme